MLTTCSKKIDLINTDVYVWLTDFWGFAGLETFLG